MLEDMDIFWFTISAVFVRAHTLKRILKVSKFEHVWAFAEGKRAPLICRNEIPAFFFFFWDLDNDIVRTNEDRVWVWQRVSQSN